MFFFSLLFTCCGFWLALWRFFNFSFLFLLLLLLLLVLTVHAVSLLIISSSESVSLEELSAFSWYDCLFCCIIIILSSCSIICVVNNIILAVQTIPYRSKVKRLLFFLFSYLQVKNKERLVNRLTTCRDWTYGYTSTVSGLARLFYLNQYHCLF